MQGRGPGVKAGAEIGFVHFEEKIAEAFIADGDVVVILEDEGDAVGSGAAGAFAERIDDQAPLGGEGQGGVFVTGKDADERRADVGAELRERFDVVNLHFALRDFGVFEVGREVGVAGKYVVGEASGGELLPQFATAGDVKIEQAEVGTLGHQHGALEAKRGGLGDELFGGERRLSPGTGVADGVQ